MKTERFPLTVTERGVSAKIRRNSKTKSGKHYDSFVVEYILLGKRKQVWRSNLEEAKTVARDACNKIANGDQSSLELRDTDRLEYARAVEALAHVGVPVDVACREYADALKILGGKASIIEACREWIKRNAVTLPQITVASAVLKVQQRAIYDGKSKARKHELDVLLNRFADAFQCEVHTIMPGLISSYLTSMPLGERSKRNHQDAIKHLNRWLVLHGYLAKGTDWMEGVQKYSKRNRGEVTIYTPEEMAKIMKAARGWEIPFCAISAFSTIRHSELKRLDWAQVELSDKLGESFIEILPIEGTKSDQRRRFIPVCDNLKVWLRSCQKQAGKVVPVEDSTTLIARIVKRAGVEFRKNGLRHSAISYRVASTGDIARTADESGNSPAIIKTNYLRRVKPAAAADWFSIIPARKVKTRSLIVPETTPDPS